jgi:predicted transcriptional regulator
MCDTVFKGITFEYRVERQMATSIKLDDDLRNRIQNLADARHRSSHWIMREAIRDYVEREEKRESLKQDALLVWEAYQKNSLHLTLEEADAWLAKLESGEDVEPPKCHN